MVKMDNIPDIGLRADKSLKCCMYLSGRWLTAGQTLKPDKASYVTLGALRLYL
jgi:hypothetical protein